MQAPHNARGNGQRTYPQEHMAKVLVFEQVGHLEMQLHLRLQSQAGAWVHVCVRRRIAVKCKHLFRSFSQTRTCAHGSLPLTCCPRMFRSPCILAASCGVEPVGSVDADADPLFFFFFFLACPLSSGSGKLGGWLSTYLFGKASPSTIAAQHGTRRSMPRTHSPHRMRRYVRRQQHARTCSGGPLGVRWGWRRHG